MSRFYGTIDGAAQSRATRRGHTELVTQAASYAGAISVRVFLDKDGNERFEIEQVKWQGHGVSESIASGVLGQKVKV